MTTDPHQPETPGEPVEEPAPEHPSPAAPDPGSEEPDPGSSSVDDAIVAAADTPAPEDDAAGAVPVSGAAETGTSAPSAGSEAGTGTEGVAEEAPFLPPQELRAILEALIFASPHPVMAREINNVLGGIPRETWEAALDELRGDYTREGRGLQLVDVAGGMQITTRPEYNDWVRELLNPKAPTRLSIQALETLAVIAYKQPVTLPEVIELRGVKSGGVIKTLLERRLVRITGRKEVVGRPMLYGTTKEFLLHFGLKDLTELPKIEEFAEVLGEEIDVEGLKKAVEAPRPTEAPLDEDAPAATEGDAGGTLDQASSPEEAPDAGIEADLTDAARDDD